MVRKQSMIHDRYLNYRLKTAVFEIFSFCLINKLSTGINQRAVSPMGKPSYLHFNKDKSISI